MYSAVELLRIQGNLESERSTYDSHCEEVGRYVLQRQQDFNSRQRMQGEKRNQHEFDSTASIALGRFAAGIESLNTPRTQRWHRLQASDPDLAKLPNVKRYYDDVTDILFRARYSTRANFGWQQQECYMSIGAWGMGAKIITDDPGNAAIRYKSVHVAQLYVMENQHGVIDAFHRKFDLTAKQAIEQFGEDRVSSKILKAVETNPSERFQFLHCVYPNTKYIAGSLNPDHFKYSSCYVEVEVKQVVKEGGYRTFPMPVSRYVTAPGEVYGRSVAMQALADIKTLNAMAKTSLIAGQMAVTPPIALHDDGVLSKIQMKPAALIRGGVDEQGRQLVKPITTGANPELGHVMMEQRREAINDAFLVTLFQILVDAPQMTATEVLQRAQEKGVLLGPIMARQESEDLGPTIERELDILSAAGELPDMPPELMEAGGADYEVYYTSPIARAMNSEAILGMQRTVEQAVQLAPINPAPLETLDLEFYVKEFGESQGAPARLYKDEKKVAAEREARQQAQQMQQMAEAAPGVAGAIKDISQAQAMQRQ